MRRIKTAAGSSGHKCFLSVTFLSFVLVPLFFLTACGKKGEPTLRAYEKPQPPALFQSFHREEKIVFQWDYPAAKETAIEDFILLKSTGTDFEILAHIDKSKRSYEETDFETGREYRYKIVARNFRGIYSDDSNILRIRPMDVPPPPSNLSFSLSGNSLLLNWTPVEKGLLYNIYKSSEKGKYGLTPVIGSPVSDNSFRDVFNINKTVFYTIRSLRAGETRDEGAQSAELKVDPSELIPSAPKNIRYQVLPDRVFLSWDEAEESWVTRFRIYRRTDSQDYLLIGETQVPTFVDNGPPLAKRDYRVHAVGPEKEGPGTELRGILYVPE
jgi:hypothetical protein